MSEVFCEIAKVGVFCDAVTHSTEKRRDGEVKVIQVTARIQPFDARLATTIRQAIRTTLFQLNHPDPHPHLRRVSFALAIPRQRICVYATPDTVKATIAFDQVKVTDVYARTEKNLDGYALVFKLVFGPPGARELEYVEQWRNGQAFLSFEVAEPSADFEEAVDDETTDEDDTRQPRLPDPEFDTDADGRPTDAAAGDAPAGETPDGARQKLHSHTEARQRRSARRSTTH